MKLRRQPYPSSKPITQSDLKNTYEDVGNVVNGGLTFTENLNGFLFTGVTAAANVEFSITHNLGRIPTGYIVFSVSAAGIVYRSATQWTTSTIYLKSSQSNMQVSIFVT